MLGSFLLRSTSMATLPVMSLAIASGVTSHRRRLSFRKIAGYEPETLVADHAAIDLDQAAMEELLELAGENAKAYDDRNIKAEFIYLDGVFSRVVAVLPIVPALVEPVARGTAIHGAKSPSEIDVSGSSYSDYDAGESVIAFQYDVADLPNGRHVGCIVGALPPGHHSMKLDGCLKAEGDLSIHGDTYTYSYNPVDDNSNRRSLALFSEHAKEKMHECETCPHKTYLKFHRYYNVFDYGHVWISAAFAGFRTTPFRNGIADFGKSTQIGRTEAIKKGTVCMNVWMYVIFKMEDALDDCERQCLDCNDNPVHAWDEAVAFYTGSLQGTAGTGEGKLLYQLANKRCADFKTCGKDGNAVEGNSYVNEEIFRNFKAGQSKLLFGQCDDARMHKEAIEKLMAVPLVQGTLRYAYKIDREAGSGEKENAEGAVFAASVLPLVHDCNPDDAQTIYDNMKLGFADAEYSPVKAAFERNYDCMGITCKQVGGLWDGGAESYHPDASPCDSGESGDFNRRAILGGALGGFCGMVLLLALLALCGRPKKRRRNTGFVPGENTSP